MITIIIDVENEESKETVLEVLEQAEGDGVLDFSFNVRTEYSKTKKESVGNEHAAHLRAFDAKHGRG